MKNASALSPSSPDELLSKIDKTALPSHIAIIMDGNGRWAKANGKSRLAGHRAGIESIRKAVCLCRDLNIKVLTLFAFSTENWKRPTLEVKGLMLLMRYFLRHYVKEFNRDNVKVLMIGRIQEMPPQVRKVIEEVTKLTSKNSGLTLVFAINYGGRTEIIDGMRRIAADVLSGRCKPNDIDEKMFRNYLYEPSLPDPDLLIRTSGEMRVSNFLLYQLSYTEIWVTPAYWPDFSKRHFLEALIDYQGRQRRYGSHS